MTVTASILHENTRERAVRDALEAVIWPGEILLGFVQCGLNPGTLADKTYYVGLTPRRFVLVRKDQPERVYSIYRLFVHTAVYSRDNWLHRRGLRLELGGDTLVLSTDPHWSQHAARLAELHEQGEPESPYLTSIQFLQQITDLTDLGQLRIARRMLRENVTANAVIEIEPETVTLQRRIEESRRALRTGAVIFVIALLFMLGGALAGQQPPVLGILLAWVAASGLLCGRQSRRGFALALALLTAALNGLMFAAARSWLDAAAWVSFGAAMVLLLSGAPSLRRTHWAVAVFILGFMGAQGYGIFTALNPPPARFADDFSTARGWVERDQDLHAAGIVNGAYAVHVRQPNSTFLAFPPVAAAPVEIQFKAWVAADQTQTPGTFGTVCGYQPDGPYYQIEIDPAAQRYAVFHRIGEITTPLSSPIWQPLSGLQEGGRANRFAVRCAGNRIDLAVNGLAQGYARASDLSPAGQMGLLVSTWPETGEQGFKVLFDDVQLGFEGQ